MAIETLTALLFLSTLSFIAVMGWVVLVVWSLADMLSAKNESAWKILWLLVILLPIIGVFLYFFIGRKQKVGGKRRA